MPWTARELRLFKSLRTPDAIQAFLDDTPYSTDPIYRSPRRVIADRRAHCVDGALFAAAALRRLGHRPLVCWITPQNDDGHLVALYRRGRSWGALAKSNFLVIRSRQPVYRSVRELMMSYFDMYFNAYGELSMRGFTRPLDLARFDRLKWETSDAGLGEIIDVALDRQPVTRVVSSAFARRLPRIHSRLLRAILRETDPKGLYNARRPGTARV